MTSEFLFAYPPTLIEDAIASYSDRVGEAEPSGVNDAYSAGFLAEIYGPRVAELVELRDAGFTHAQWARKTGETENRWHGCAPTASAVKR